MGRTAQRWGCEVQPYQASWANTNAEDILPQSQSGMYKKDLTFASSIYLEVIPRRHSLPVDEENLLHYLCSIILKLPE